MAATTRGSKDGDGGGGVLGKETVKVTLAVYTFLQTDREAAIALSVVLLARVVTRLGDVQVTDWVIEHLFASDLAFLQDLYRRINAEGHTRAALSCPECQHSFTVDLSGGGGLGGS